MKILREALAVAIGAVLFSAAMNMLLLPGGVVLGGMTGIATVLNLFWSFPVGVTILGLNLPLVLLGAKRFGRRFVVRTLIGVAATSAAADFLPVVPTDATPLTAAILGGVLIGVSVGLLLAREYTTGGTDLVALLLREIIPGISLGTAIAIADTAIIVTAAALTGSWTGILYSAACTAVTAVTTDAVLRLSR